MGTSFSNDLYKLIPNDTDMTIFKEKGCQVLNFAHVNDAVYYHAAIDSLENVDQATLQHQADVAVSLARHFARTPVAESERDVVYFNTLFGFIQYPTMLATPLALIALVLLVVAFQATAKKTEIKVKPILATLFFSGLLFLFMTVALVIVWIMHLKFHPEYERWAASHIYNGPIFFAGFCALALAVAFWYFDRASRKRTRKFAS